MFDNVDTELYIRRSKALTITSSVWVLLCSFYALFFLFYHSLFMFTLHCCSSSFSTHKQTNKRAPLLFPLLLFPLLCFTSCCMCYMCYAYAATAAAIVVVVIVVVRMMWRRYFPIREFVQFNFYSNRAHDSINSIVQQLFRLFIIVYPKIPISLFIQCVMVMDISVMCVTFMICQNGKNQKPV